MIEGLTDGALYRNTLRILEFSSEIISLNRNALERLKLPRRAIAVSVPVKMDDGHVQIFPGKLVAQYDQLMIVPVAEGRSPTPIAMLMPQADQVWINYVNTWITLKQEQGFFDELGRKWQLIGETG